MVEGCDGSGGGGRGMRGGRGGRSPWTKVVSWLLMLIWESCSRGRTGPVNWMLVGSLWPNRSTSPGPDRLRLGALAPTWITCPATVTVCNGVTCSEAAIAPAADAISNTSPASHRLASWAHRPVRCMLRIVPIPSSTLTTAASGADPAARVGPDAARIEEIPERRWLVKQGRRPSATSTVLSNAIIAAKSAESYDRA